MGLISIKLADPSHVRYPPARERTADITGGPVLAAMRRPSRLGKDIDEVLSVPFSKWLSVRIDYINRAIDGCL